MKKGHLLLVTILTALLTLGVCGSGLAAIVPSFILIDGKNVDGSPGDGEITLSVTSYFGQDYTLHYNTTNRSVAGWESFDLSKGEIFKDMTLIDFALSKGDDRLYSYDTTNASFTFFQPMDPGSATNEDYQGGYYGGVSIYWLLPGYSGVRLDIISSANRDGPNLVPLPGAAWLLGAGLIVLIGIRRKCFSE